ncbi:MAG: thioredoxin family protein [Acidobacteria bacterium]|nr:thioredoxin family protein [Acidobacteriota bacterium]
MPIVHISRDTFGPTVNSDNITLIDCWASWCGACATFDPVYRRAAGRHPEHTFGKIDTQAERELIKELGVEHIPSLLIYREGILLFRQPGYYTEEQLEDIVRQAESLDMNEVRAYMESEGREEKEAE